jgi:hypothetical protein
MTTSIRTISCTIAKGRTATAKQRCEGLAAGFDYAVQAADGTILAERRWRELRRTAHTCFKLVELITVPDPRLYQQQQQQPQRRQQQQQEPTATANVRHKISTMRSVARNVPPGFTTSSEQ